MAYVKSIWIHSADKETDCLTAYVLLQPAGEVQVKFTLPPKFRQCIIDAAQAAADLHEQQMKAEILADTKKEIN